MGASPPPSISGTTLREASTVSTAARNASQPDTSSTDVNMPAIDVASLSSIVDDERTTTEHSPP